MNSKQFKTNMCRDVYKISGTCPDMCPETEKALRIKENIINSLEKVQGELILVKSFSRSAADSNMAVQEALRPYPVLKKTLQYLLYCVARRTDVTVTALYDFLNDRLRAVRQDMTIQRIPPEQCVELLEPMIRFHVYFAYRLCERPMNEFDPILNKKYVLECIKWYLSCHDKMDGMQKYDRINNVSDSFKMMNLKDENTFDRALIESLYVMCNLDDVQPILRYLGLPCQIKRLPPLKLAYEIAIANLKGNFIRVCRLAQTLCPLTKCAFCLYLPSLQRNSLQILSTSHSSKQLSVPREAVQRWLLYNDNVDVGLCCQHYGLDVGNGVLFNKTMFKAGVQTHKPRLNCNFNVPEFQDILNYNCNVLNNS